LLLAAVCLLIGGLVLNSQRVHHRQQGEIGRNIISLLLRSDAQDKKNKGSAASGCRPLPDMRIKNCPAGSGQDENGAQMRYNG
ncbi:MAG: hypothetical protein J5564_06665, partial [Clostridia bacterium]|nr:hypothetical protein [Clostridia bacterium]